jgi:hypothetical protein
MATRSDFRSVLSPTASTDAAIRKTLNKRGAIRKIAATLGVGTGTVQRIKPEMSA